MVVEDVHNSLEHDRDRQSACRVRFQQSPVEVYARFKAEDHDSGRESFFVSRRTLLLVTDLVQGYMRVSDPRIATLHGRVVQGRSSGRTEVQVGARSGDVLMEPRNFCTFAYVVTWFWRNLNVFDSAERNVNVSCLPPRCCHPSRAA